MVVIKNEYTGETLDIQNLDKEIESYMIYTNCVCVYCNTFFVQHNTSTSSSYKWCVSPNEQLILHLNTNGKLILDYKEKASSYMHKNCLIDKFLINIANKICNINVML